MIRLLILGMLIGLMGCSSPQGRDAVIPDYEPAWGVPGIPVSAHLVAQDQANALHTLANALSRNKLKLRYLWTNSLSGNRGEVRLIGTIRQGRFRGCRGFENQVIIRGVVHREYSAACRGGGNSNTWIINKRWVISSITRSKHGRCRVRFLDTKIEVGRVQNIATLCFTDGAWNTGG